MYGMSKYKTSSACIILIYPNLSSQHINRNPANSQTQSRSLRIFIQFGKAVENHLLFLQWNSTTCICNRKNTLLPGSSIFRSSRISPFSVNLFALDNKLIRICCKRCPSVSISKVSTAGLNTYTTPSLREQAVVERIPLHK